MFTLTVNGIKRQVDAPPDTPLLWALRDNLGITSVKYTCGIAECGMCTVLINGAARRSCAATLEEVEGSGITTIEGLPDNHPVKLAWIEKQVPQCGYCQPGIMLQTVDFLARVPHPSEAQINEAMDNVICRLRIASEDESGDQAGRRNDCQTGRLNHENRYDEKIVSADKQSGYCRYSRFKFFRSVQCFSGKRWRGDSVQTARVS